MMKPGNQTLLLSGSLLSNAASELAQTLRSDLLQMLDQPISVLSQFGLTDTCISKLESSGFLLVTDLNFLQVAHLRSMGFSSNEVPLLSEICNEVRRTISVGSLSKILKNASENITEIAANLPIKNTFIDFPSLFPNQPQERHPQSCPAFFLDDEKRAIAELEASIHNHALVAASRSQLNDLDDDEDGCQGILISRPGEYSKGAADHGSGNCKPCAWFHHAEGCRHAGDCEFCHMCPAGEIKKRKKEKQKMIKSMKSSSQQYTNYSSPDNSEIGETPIMTPPIGGISGQTVSSAAPPNRSGLSNWIGNIFSSSSTRSAQRV